MAPHLAYKTFVLQIAASGWTVWVDWPARPLVKNTFKIRQTYTDSLNDEIAKPCNRRSKALPPSTPSEKKPNFYQKQLNAKQRPWTPSHTLALILHSRSCSHSSFQAKEKSGKESELQNANALIQGQGTKSASALPASCTTAWALWFLPWNPLHLDGRTNEQPDQSPWPQQPEKAIGLLDETYEEVRRISHDRQRPARKSLVCELPSRAFTQLLQSTNKLQVQYIDNNLLPETYKTLWNRPLPHYAGAAEQYHKICRCEVSIQLSSNNGNLVYLYEDDGKDLTKEQLQSSKGIGYKNIATRVLENERQLASGYQCRTRIKPDYWNTVWKTIDIIIADDHLLFAEGL